MASTTTENLGILFLVDVSQSTKTTDPGYQVRIATIQDFIAQYGNGVNNNLYYSFGYFGGDAYAWDIGTSKFVEESGTKNEISGTLFGTDKDLTNAFDYYCTGTVSGAFTKCDSDGTSDGTSYVAPLEAAQNLILADETLQKNTRNYAIVFMSDGEPNDDPDSTSGASLVTSLMKAIQINGVSATLSTVYFGPTSDTTSITLMKDMAGAGGGQFDENNTTPLVINQVITVPGSCSMTGTTSNGSESGSSGM